MITLANMAKAMKIATAPAIMRFLRSFRVALESFRSFFVDFIAQFPSTVLNINNPTIC